MCRDPRNPNGYFIADTDSIRYFDEAKDEVTLNRYAGSVQIDSVVIDSRGETIWCAATSGGLRRIHTASGQVTTEYRGSVFSLCWDLAPSVKLDSVLYCITIGNGGELSRFDIASSEMSTRLGGRSGIFQITCTAAGYVVCSTLADDLESAVIVVLDPTTGIMHVLDDLDAAGLLPMTDEQLFIIDHSHTLVAFAYNSIICQTLPPQYFPLPKCCDRDL